MKNKLYDQIYWLCEMIRKKETAPPEILGLKLGSETGEFQEAVSMVLGFNQHKQDDDGPFGEAADVINTLLSAIVRLYPQMTSEEIIAELLHRSEIKGLKYQRILDNQKNNNNND